MTTSWEIELSELGVVRSRGPMLIRPSTLSANVRGNLGIVGPSGAGKTLLARAIIDVLPPGLSRTGSAKIRVRSDSGLADYIAIEHIPMIPQSPASALPAAISCRSFLTHALRWGEARDRRQSGVSAADLLKMVHLEPTEIFPLQASQLSGGMAQRFSIALALARAAKVIILDEPTVGLDASARRAVLATIESLTNVGYVFVVVSHDPEAIGTTQEVMRVQNGTLTLESSNG